MQGQPHSQTILAAIFVSLSPCLTDHLGVGWHRLSRRSALAKQTRSEQRSRYLRFSERQLLLLSKHLDEPTRSASAAPPELAGKEGKVISVTCFTNCETVELFLNGESLGVKGYSSPRPGMVGHYGHYPPGANLLQTTADLYLTWDVPYTPGTLTAKGIKDGKVIEAVEVHTAGAPAKFALINDRQRLRTTPDDIAHVTVNVQDEQGRIVPTADNAITFSLTGAGRILGVDNGQPDSHEPYKAIRRHAFNGLALVLVQSNGRPGQITLSASSPLLASSQITIEAN
jgi:beta-galactosidase